MEKFYKKLTYYNHYLDFDFDYSRWSALFYTVNHTVKTGCPEYPGRGSFYNCKTKLVFYCPVNGTNYSTAVIVEYSEYYNHLSGLHHSIVIVSIIVVILGLIIAILVGNSLKPLNNLGDAINEIASGNADLTKRLHFKRTKSEIAYVVNGFNFFPTLILKIFQKIIIFKLRLY